MKIEEINKEFISKSILRSLGKKEFSVWSLTKKFREKFPDHKESVYKVIEEFKKKKWVSDERFCEIYIREKSQYSGWGEKKIIFKLNENHIDEDIVSKYLHKYFSEEKQIEKAKDLVLEKMSKISLKKGISDYDKNQKIKMFLVSRGFSFDIAQIAVDSIKKEI